MKTLFGLVAAMLIATPLGAAPDPISRLETPPSAPFTVSGKGVINDAGHPMHPGSFRAIDVTIRIAMDPATGGASIEVVSGEGDKKDTDRYFLRRGRIFQVDDKDQEIPATPLADLSPAAVAALHPALVANALCENRQNAKSERAGSYLFAANDALWTAATDVKTDRIASLTRRDFDEVAGDGTEEVVYERDPMRVTVRKRGRVTARFAFGPPESVASVAIPEGDGRRDRGHSVSAAEIKLVEMAPHVFTIELASLNTRVTVLEFTDHVMVIEGAYDARIGDALVRAIGERLQKPIRYHAFSHLHGQYIGSTRAFVAVGATILVPPSTAPLIEEIAAAPHALQPDALSAAPRKPSIEAVKTERLIEDGMNAVHVFNVVSEHTDEYFVFWLPGPKILLTGDLLFYRPGKPLTGRSKRICTTVAELKLQPERYLATWPLDGYGTKNVVTGDEMRAACDAAP